MNWTVSASVGTYTATAEDNTTTVSTGLLKSHEGLTIKHLAREMMRKDKAASIAAPSSDLEKQVLVRLTQLKLEGFPG